MILFYVFAAMAQEVERRLGKNILTGLENIILSCLGSVGRASPW